VTVALPGSTIIELEPARPSKVRLSARLLECIANLEIPVSKGDSAELGETLLLEGATVEVEGHLDVSGSSYRSLGGDVLTGWDESPMLIRVLD
jgi:hypothetical protein